MRNERVYCLDKESNLINLPREEAEYDESYRQIIPYVIFKYKDSIAVFKRFNGGEERLKDQYTIGIGGHINTNDIISSEAMVMMSGMIREIEEEVKLKGLIYDIKYLFSIESDATEVDRVHKGFVYIVELDKPEVDTNNSELLFIDFYNYKQLRDITLESWSEIVLDYFINEGIL